MESGLALLTTHPRVVERETAHGPFDQVLLQLPPHLLGAITGYGDKVRAALGQSFDRR